MKNPKAEDGACLAKSDALNKLFVNELKMH